MARSPNCTGAPTYRGRVDVTISYPDPYEPPLLDPPEALPTSEPTTAQIEITITQAMLPVWSPYELPHVKTAFLYAGGKNTSGGSISIYYRLLRNGENVLTGSASVGAGLSYIGSFARWLDVQPGDVLACKLWAGAAGCNWDYKALTIYSTRIGLGRERLLFDVLVIDEYPPNLAKCDYLAGVGSMAWLPIPNTPNTEVFWQSASNKRLPMVRVDKDYGFARGIYSDRSALASVRTGSTRGYYIDRVLTRISYTPLNLRV